MKRLIYILFLMTYLVSVFANDMVEYPTLEPLPKIHLDTPISSGKYSYFTLGSGVLLQQAGIGGRYRNFENLKGHDISLNGYFSLPLLSGIDRYKYPVYPSVKYTYLKYRNSSPTSPYFGVSCEGVFAIDKPRYYYSLFESVQCIPNIGLIWGRERENMRFTQLQLNVIPAVGLIVGTGFFLFGSNRGAIISERNGGKIMALGSASVLLSYSAGF